MKHTENQSNELERHLRSKQVQGPRHCKLNELQARSDPTSNSPSPLGLKSIRIGSFAARILDRLAFSTSGNPILT